MNTRIATLIPSLALAVLLPATLAHADTPPLACSPIETPAPAAKALVAKNIQQVQLQYANMAKPCSDNLGSKTIQALNKAVNDITAKTLAGSTSSYEVTIRFLLEKSAPATMELDVARTDMTDAAVLERYASALEKLKDYHALSGSGYVALRYRVTPKS